MAEVKLSIRGDADSDAAEVADLASDLEVSLRHLDVDKISRPERPAPEGAKGTALEWAQLVVTFAGALPPLFTVIQGWLHDHPGSSVTLEIDGDEIMVGDASEDERRELLAAWTKRHGG